MQNGKSKMTAMLLSIFLGGLGIDRFYLGYTGLGVLKLLTAGCFGILYLIDIIYICTGNLKPADGSEYVDDLGGKPVNTTKNNLSTADTIMKYKELLDAGVLTQDEFDMKKKELLNI